MATLSLARAPAFTAVRDAHKPRRARRVVQRVNASSEPNAPQESISEDMLERLKQAEAEAARLRQELELAKGSTAAVEAAPAVPAVPKKRIDGGDLRRETLFMEKENQRNWLQESDVDFFTKPTASTDGNGEEADAEVVKRRLIIGVLAAAGLGAFALVPTENLSLSKPSKPLFFYITPLLRVQDLLGEAVAAIEAGDEETLSAILARVEGPPNNLQENLRNAAASLPENRQIEAAQAVGREVYEAVVAINPQEYFEVRKADGKMMQQLNKFSLQATQAAQAKLREFLALMPRDQLDAARQAMA